MKRRPKDTESAYYFQRLSLANHCKARGDLGRTRPWLRHGYGINAPAPSLAQRVLLFSVVSVVVLAWVIIFGATLWAVGEMVR